MTNFLELQNTSDFNSPESESDTFRGMSEVDPAKRRVGKKSLPVMRASLNTGTHRYLK